MPNPAQNIGVWNAPASKPQAPKPASKPGQRTPGARQPEKPQIGAQQTAFARALTAAQTSRRGVPASVAGLTNPTGLPNALGEGFGEGLGAGTPIVQQLANVQALAQRMAPVPGANAARPAAAGAAANAVSPAAARPTLDLPGGFGAIVDQAARKYGVDPALIAAVMKTESSFNPDAVSKAGAQGLMQLMPATARGLGVTDSTNPLQAVMGGAKLLGQLLDKYNGNTELALAAYNAGSGAVDKFGGIPPYAETRKYVPLVMTAYEGFRQQAGTSAAPARPAAGR